MRKLLLIAALMASGCGGGSSNNGGTGGTGGTGTTGTFDQACANLTQATTSKFVACLKANTAALASVLQGAAFSSSNQCTDGGKAIAASRASYDSAKAASCLAAFGAATCDTLESVADSACQGVLTGKVAAGGACYTDVDCSGGTCDASGSSCPGKCVASIAKGQPCGAAAAGQCGPGLVCGSGSTCVTPAAAGAVCGADDDCQAGLFCNTSGGGVCTAKKKSGACTGSECALGYACVQSTCTALVGENGACTLAAAPQTECGLGWFCAPSSSTCQAWPGLGSSCAASLVCMTGYCDFLGDQTCKAPKADGSACLTPIECQSGFCDLLGDHTCKACTGTGCSPILTCHEP